MQKYSLTLKSKGLEREYHLQQIDICKRQSKPLLFIYLIISFINLVYLSIDQIKSNNNSNERSQLSTNQFYFILAFLILWIISIVASLIMIYQVPNKFNLFYSFQQFINIFYHLILIYYELNISDSLFPSSNKMIDDSKISSSSTVYGKPLIQFHFLEGFLLAIIINRGFIGTKFLVKACFCTVTIVSLICISLNELQNPFIQISLGIVCLGILLSQIYEEDKNKRQDFLLRRKDEEWNKIIKNVLPTNFIIARYNQKESRVELEQANRKANRELGITNNDNFQKFTKSTLVQNNEIIQNEKDLNRILKGMHQIPISGQCIPNQGHPPVGIQRDFTLYQLIRQKIEQETINSKRKMSNQKSANVLNNLDGIIETINDVIIQTNTGSSNRQKKKSIQSVSNQNINQSINTQNTKKVNEYIGTYRPNGFDVDKKLLIRVSTFSLSEIFAVITIENETYREKYIKQIKFSTFLEKIFSFQLKKFKESYLVVLNELNKINNQSVLNQLLYHNVKCMNRVNSYLQYFEFKNSSKHEFSVTEFSLNAEMFKILRSLKHYIVGKRIRTYYENTTNQDKISTDEERLQQIFFMILEHLMVNAPMDGYLAIRITNDQTISNCFKIQIQSTYDSDLLNQINLQTFNIDELYNDYEVYQNYFVSLRIAIKLVTLMGPYNKIEFHRSDKNILFTSFSIFSDLEVIKTQQIKTQIFNNNNNVKLGLTQQVIQNPQIQQDISQNGANSSALGSGKNNNETTSIVKNTSQKNQEKNGECNFNNTYNNSNINNQQIINKKCQTTLNNISSSNELNDSGNVSETYDEQSSFNQWFKVKQLQHSSLANQKVFDVISTNQSNNTYKKTSQKYLDKEQPVYYQPAGVLHNRSSGSGENSNSLSKTNSAVFSDFFTEEQRDISKSNNLMNYRSIPNNYNNISKDNQTIAAYGNVTFVNATIGAFNNVSVNMNFNQGDNIQNELPNLSQNQAQKTIILNNNIEESTANPLINSIQQSKFNKNYKSPKKTYNTDKRYQINFPKLKQVESQKNLARTPPSFYMQHQQYQTQENLRFSVLNQQSLFTKKVSSQSSRQNDKDYQNSYLKGISHVYSAGELANDSEVLPIHNNQQQKVLKKKGKY
ncbi:hypothetical protein ABPG72_005673 [Tetrahymena utriculariae]